jgi:hypothetical protein
MKQRTSEPIYIDAKLQNKLKSEASLLNISLKKYSEDRLQRETIHDILIKNFKEVNQLNVLKLVDVLIESNEFHELVSEKIKVINGK